MGMYSTCFIGGRGIKFWFELAKYSPWFTWDWYKLWFVTKGREKSWLSTSSTFCMRLHSQRLLWLHWNRTNVPSKKITVLWNVMPCRLPVNLYQTARRHIADDNFYIHRSDKLRSHTTSNIRPRSLMDYDLNGWSLIFSGSRFRELLYNQGVGCDGLYPHRSPPRRDTTDGSVVLHKLH